METLGTNLPYLLRGARVTVLLFAASLALGTVVGVGVGLLSAARHPVPRGIVTVYVFLTRGIPLLVHLFLVYYLLPVIGLDLDPYVGATIVTPNRKELQDVVGRWKSDDQLAEKALSLRKRLGLQALLVTLGKDGMTLFEERRVHHEPARAREVFDVSGAGDTVIATLGAMLGAGAPLHDAVVAANQAAGIVVGKLGTAVVHPEELMAELAQGR